MANDPLASLLAKLVNAQKVGKATCSFSPSSKVIAQVLDIFNEHGYLGSYEALESKKGTHLTINLLGNINRCGAIKPRYSVSKNGFEKFEKRYLPGKDFGVLVVSTPKGIMTHLEAKKKGLGGVLLAYCY